MPRPTVVVRIFLLTVCQCCIGTLHAPLTSMLAKHRRAQLTIRGGELGVFPALSWVRLPGGMVAVLVSESRLPISALLGSACLMLHWLI